MESSWDSIAILEMPESRSNDFALRFWARVNKSESCWTWSGCKMWGGYGRVGISQRVAGAHRVAYILSRGAIPAKLQIDHLCKKRDCVNPWHLEIVTHSENILRGMAPTIVARRTGVCKRGHSNFVRNKNGHYFCSTCHKYRVSLYAKGIHLRKSN